MKLQKEDIVRYTGEHSALKGKLFSVRGFWRRGEVVAKDLATSERIIFNPDDVEIVEELKE